MEFRPVEAIENMFKDTAESLCNAATGPARVLYGIADNDPRAAAGAALSAVSGAASTLDTINGGFGGLGRRALHTIGGEAANSVLDNAGIKLSSGGRGEKEWPCISGEYNKVAGGHKQRIPEWAQRPPAAAPATAAPGMRR